VNRTVEPTENGERLDRFVASVGDLSRSHAKALIEAGAVTIDGGVVDRASHRVRSGDGVVVSMPDGPPPPPVVADPSIAFDVVHEDEDVIVVDKPAGVVVHPGAGRTGGTLADGLLARFPELAGVGPAHRPGIVHRLDRGTSGLLIVARTSAAHEHLTAALATHDITREYEALVWGAMGSARGIVDAPIGRSRRDPTKRAIVEDGRAARTHYEVGMRYEHPDAATLLTCRLETGRTHQIRVHLAAIDHPVAGDGAYGGARADIGLDRPFLHAKRLVFEHPRTGGSIVITSPRPVELVEALSRLS
jgi:23S rRNA pseudouridine1911/1915/1917 synthase